MYILSAVYILFRFFYYFIFAIAVCIPVCNKGEATYTIELAYKDFVRNIDLCNQNLSPLWVRIMKFIN